MLYVDDISDIIVESSTTSLLARAEERAAHIVEWLLDNCMVLSLHKSMFIVQATRELRRTRAIPFNLTITVQNHYLPNVQSSKLLGLTLNQDITWD